LFFSKIKAFHLYKSFLLLLTTRMARLDD